MPCYCPINGYFVLDEITGKKKFFFDPVAQACFEANVPMPSQIEGRQQAVLPCGRCQGCRLERSRQWALRLMYEKKFHEDNVFLTLTYDDKKLPKDGSLNVEHFQNFMKRLRAHHQRCGDGMESNFNKPLRFFHCGEYGDRTFRPHYHAIIFNLDFTDKVLYKQTDNGPLFNSALLEKIWTFGHCIVAGVTFESSAYVARYIMKKVTGNAAEDHYSVLDRNSGELHNRKPEYITMSRRPGIAHSWYKQFKQDAYPSDYLIVRGARCKPPRYFDNQLAQEEPELLASIKERRIQRALDRAAENSYSRLKVKEEIQRLRVERLVRPLD